MNPLWIPILYAKPVAEKKQKKLMTDSELHDESFQLDERNFKDNQDEENTTEKCMFSLMQIIAIHALQTADETILMFIYDLTLFRNITNFLNNPRLPSKMKLSKLYDETSKELREYFEARYKEYKEIMKQLFFTGLIPINIEHI